MITDTSSSGNPAIVYDPEIDLVFERDIDLAPELVWAAWTRPEHIVHWFTPAPWKTLSCEIDLRPGGNFRTVMASPEGHEVVNTGCFLEIVENRRLMWTDAMSAGYRPRETPFITAIISLEAISGGTRYVATAIHSNAESRKKHEAMGFREGWGKALDQLVAYMKTV